MSDRDDFSRRVVGQLAIETPNEDEVGAAVLALCGAAPPQIRTDEERQQMEEWVTLANKRLKRWEEFFDGFLKPLRAAVTQQRDRIGALLNPLRAAITERRQLCESYVLKKAKEAEEQRRKEEAKYQASVAKAAEKGKPAEFVPPPKHVEAPTKQVKTVEGAIGYSMEWKAKLFTQPGADTDGQPLVNRTTQALHVIPDQYWILDWKAVKQDVKRGYEIPGFERFQAVASRVRR